MAASEKLFGRRHLLSLGTLDISELDIEFEVKKTLKPEPNTAHIKVWNLSETSRESLAEQVPLQVRLEAGYTSRVSQIFLGEARYAYSIKDGPDIVTLIHTGDSEKEIALNRCKVQFAKLTPPEVILQKLASELKIPIGNLSQALKALKAKGKVLCPAATVFTGNAWRNIQDFCRSAGLECSVQDGSLLILDMGFGIDATAQELDAESGLIGSPTVDSNGTVNAVCLMIPDIRPGSRVNFRTLSVGGLYRVETAEYQGSTFANKWYIRITCKPEGDPTLGQKTKKSRAARVKVRAR